MTKNTEQPVSARDTNNLQLDEVLTTQPELGPSIPDGGFGWIVFIGTLFFQALIPCLIVNFGIFVAFTKLENSTNEDQNMFIWDEKIFYVPLFYCISKIIFDSFARSLTLTTTTPRLISVVGTCLTCAGLLFIWMGMTSTSDHWLFAPAGLLSGVGSSIILVQCETLLCQYFRLKLPILELLSHYVAILGFITAPLFLGQHILNTSLSQVLLWYQAIILQGLVVSLLFRKPLYLKKKQRSKPYQFISSNPDDEEDILSKNSRELQIKRQTSTETRVSTIPLEQPQPGPSTSSRNEELVQIEENHFNNETKPKNWVNFEDEENVNKDEIKYAKLHDWETFDDDVDIEQNEQRRKWERFEDDEPSSPGINNLSLAEETNTQRFSTRPSPLFADLPVNNNNSYAYDDEIVPDTTRTNVFAPNNTNNESFKKHLDVLKEISFYKTLLMMIANTYSTFVFFALYPSYLYIEATSVDIKHMTEFVGILSVMRMVFLSVIYWINVDKKKRPICLWIFYWIGSVGYFMISDFKQEYLLLVGGAQIVLSIEATEYISKPLLRLPSRGGTSTENFLLCVFSSLSLFLFLFINISFKSCFRLVAILHFFTGTLWLANFVYKRLRIK